MSKTRLYPDDIREAVLADIRAFDACRNVRNVAIVPVNAPEAETNWAIDFIADGAAQAAASASRSSIARGSIRMTISSQVNANRLYSLRSAALPAVRARSIHKSACSRNSCGVNTTHSKLRNNRSRSKHVDRLSAAATKLISARRSECRSRKTLMPSFHRR